MTSVSSELQEVVNGAISDNALNCVSTVIFYVVGGAYTGQTVLAIECFELVIDVSNDSDLF